MLNPVIGCITVIIGGDLAFSALDVSLEALEIF
jgi:hypothetical protein